MYLAAFFIAFTLLKVQIKEKSLKVNKDEALNLFFWAIIGLLAGARLFAVTIYDTDGYYLKHPLQTILPFAVINGRFIFTGLQGMSYHGGLLGTFISCIIYLRVKKMDIWEWTDMLVTAAPLGYTFGRLGNFINAELYGRVTTVPWGMVFPTAKKFPAAQAWVQDIAGRVGMAINGNAWVNLPRHPSQLYEAFFEGIFLWAVLWFVFRKRRLFKGFLLSVYLMGYGLIRFIIEYFREPDIEIGYPIQLVKIDNPNYQISPFNFTIGQILCFLMIACGITAIFLFRKAAQKEKQRVKSRPDLRKLRKKIR
jgi:phosphatidylglycerol:prolipoprotein diacylglycerol transferase